MAYDDERGIMTTNRMRYLEEGIQRLDIAIDHYLNLLLCEVMEGNQDPSTRVKTAKLQVELGGIKTRVTRYRSQRYRPFRRYPPADKRNKRYCNRGKDCSTPLCT